MAEIFKNYSSGMPVLGYGIRNENKSIVVVPYAGEAVDKGAGLYGWSNSRKENTISQIHSIYISLRNTNKLSGLDRYNPKNFGAFNLYIENKNSNNSTNINYIVYDGRIVPGAPFFIEKNITLESNQRLILECPSDSKDLDTVNNVIEDLNTDGSVIVEISASTVLLPDTSESAN